MITRKEYRNNLLKNKNKSNNKILTDEEFYELPIDKRYRYADLHKKFGLPVTVEQDTPYDEKIESIYKPVELKSSKEVKGHKLLDFMGKIAKLDLVLSYCGLTK